MNTQSGRSMVEMLGVLAIIGVLFSSSLDGGTCSSGSKCLKNLKLDDIYDFCTKHYGVNSPTGTEMMISWKR